MTKTTPITTSNSINVNALAESLHFRSLDFISALFILTTSSRFGTHLAREMPAHTLPEPGYLDRMALPSMSCLVTTHAQSDEIFFLIVPKQTSSRDVMHLKV
jgi:hypothetical protein